MWSISCKGVLEAIYSIWSISCKRVCMWRHVLAGGPGGFTSFEGSFFVGWWELPGL